MTPLERAEKMAIHLSKYVYDHDSIDIDFIAAQIAEAEREALKYKADPNCAEHCKLAYLEGFRAAQEKAAGIAENANEPFVNWNAFTAAIATKIRAMEPTK